VFSNIKIHNLVLAQINLSNPILCGLVCKRFRSVPIDYLCLQSTRLRDSIPLIDVVESQRIGSSNNLIAFESNQQSQSTIAAEENDTQQDNQQVEVVAASRSFTTTLTVATTVTNQQRASKRTLPIRIISAHLRPILSRVRALEIRRASWPLYALDALFVSAPKLERLYLKSHK
jgi:hypothetical protein